MPWHDVDIFLREVCSHIKYKRVHAGISEELRHHIEDRISDYLDEGVDEEAAVKRAVEAMGDPEEVGKELNKLHKPYLGWALTIVNTFIVLVGLWMALTLIPNFFTFLKPYSMPAGKNVQYSIPLNQKDRIDDRTIVVQKLLVDKSGIVYIGYKEYSKPFSLGWSMLDFEVYDDKGNKYYGGAGGEGTVFGIKHVIQIDNLNKDASKIILNYDYYNRKMRFEIPLKGGDGK